MGQIFVPVSSSLASKGSQGESLGRRSQRGLLLSFGEDNSDKIARPYNGDNTFAGKTFVINSRCPSLPAPHLFLLKTNPWHLQGALPLQEEMSGPAGFWTYISWLSGQGKHSFLSLRVPFTVEMLGGCTALF